MARKETHGRAWLKAYLDQGKPTFFNSSASAKRAGYRAKTDDSFRSIGYANRKKYGPMIDKWLHDYGYDETTLKEKVVLAMEARETVYQKVRGKVVEGSLAERSRIIATTEDGDTLLAIDVPALQIQVKALEMALKVKGLYTGEKHQQSGSVATKLVLTNQDRVLLKQIIDASIKKLTEIEHEKPAISPAPSRRLDQITRCEL